MTSLRRGLAGIEASGPARWVAAHPFLAGAAALVALSAFAYAPLLAGGGMILTGDTLHPMRLYEMGRCLDDGQIPCRWAPDLGNGYGQPLFNYYGALPYYAGDPLHRVFHISYVRTTDALYVVGLVGAGLSMYALTRRLWGDLGGLVSGVAYVFAPYLALDVYMRGALVELWALAVMPALLWAVYELLTTGRRRFMPAIAVLTAFLLLSHQLVAVIFAPALLLWTVALVLRQGRPTWRPVLLGGVGALWGFALAAFFTLPVLTEGDQAQLENLVVAPYFHYASHFVSAGDLFWHRSADYGFLLGRETGTPVQIGWFHWGLAGLSVPAAAVFARRGRWFEGLAVVIFVVFFGVGVFMTVSRSEFVWDTFGALRFLQFPWRYMALVSFGAAGLAGAWLGALRDRPAWTQLAVAAALIGVFIGTGRMFFVPEARCVPELRCPRGDAEYFGQYFAGYQAGGIEAYLPTTATAAPAEPPPQPAFVLTGVASIEDMRASSDGLRLSVRALTPVVLEASVFDYPNWRVRVDGEVVPHRPSVPFGLIAFEVPEGAHEVELRLENTGIRRLGNGISLAAWLALVAGVPAALFAPAARRWWTTRKAA